VFIKTISDDAINYFVALWGKQETNGIS